MSFKENWENFSSNDRFELGCWTANAAIWGMGTVGAIALSAGASVVVVPMLACAGMTTATISSYKERKIKTAQGNVLQQAAAKEAKRNFGDDLKKLPTIQKCKIIGDIVALTLMTAGAVALVGTGAPGYLSLACVASAAGFAKAGASDYEVARREISQISGGKQIEEKQSKNIRRRQRVQSIQPQTLQEVKEIHHQKAQQQTKVQSKQKERTNLLEAATIQKYVSQNQSKKQ